MPGGELRHVGDGVDQVATALAPTDLGASANARERSPWVVRLWLGRKLRKAAAAALKDGRKVRGKIVVHAADPSGNDVSARRSIRLRRPRGVYQRSWTSGRMSLVVDLARPRRALAGSGARSAAAAFPRACSGLRAPGMTTRRRAGR